MVNRNYKVQTDMAPKIEPKPPQPHQHSKQCRARKLEVAQQRRARQLHPHELNSSSDEQRKPNASTDNDQKRRTQRTINEKLEKILNESVTQSNGLFPNSPNLIISPMPQLPTIRETEDSDGTAMNKVSTFKGDEKRETYQSKYKYLSPFSEREVDKPDSGGANFDRPKFQFISDKPDEHVENAKGYFHALPSHFPDALYRVSDLADSENGSRDSRCDLPTTFKALAIKVWRVIRWPFVVISVCVLLASLFYVLLPDTNKMQPYISEHHSDNIKYDGSTKEQSWPQDTSPTYQVKSISDVVKAITNPEMMTKMSTAKPSNPVTKSIDSDNKTWKSHLTSTTTTTTTTTTTSKTPVNNEFGTKLHPIYPTNLAPSVQYGNEKDIVDKKTLKKDLLKDSGLDVLFSIGNNDNIDQPMLTSGHQNSFGVPLEESSTYASYNTRVSPTLPSIVGMLQGDATTTKLNATEDPGLCQSTRLKMCRGVLPYDLTTTLPLITGISNNEDLETALPYFERIMKSGCSLRARQFICTLLEPECKPKGMTVLPPCRRACKVVTESCESVILQTLELAPIFDCDQYPDFNDPSKCVNLARNECMPNEHQCPADNSCIPKYWRCDGIPDCPNDTDELNCTDCKPEEFRCSSNSATCVPRAWRCDGFVDCPDGSDERGCRQLLNPGEEIPSAAESAHPAPVILPHPDLKRIVPLNKHSSEAPPRLVKYNKPILHHSTAKQEEASSAKTPDSESQEILMMSDTIRPSRPKLYQNVRLPAKEQTRPPVGQTSHTSPCPQGELRCLDGRCITVGQLCDGMKDCNDGSDENNCNF